MASRKGINQDKIQELNKALLLNMIREEGVCSRAVLSQLSGLNKATITYIVNEFIEMQCVKEIGLLAGEKGRRSIGIALSDEKYYVIGVRLARTYFKVAVFNLRGEIEEIQRDKINGGETAYSTIETIVLTIQKMIKKNESRQLLLVGMAIPGPFLKEKGKIGIMTGGREFEQIGFKSTLEEKLKVKVILEHDAKAGAFAQLWFDKEIDKKDSLIYIAAGEGIGAGIILNQEIVYGRTGTAGEIGHMTIKYDGEKCECGNRGCLEKYCSVLALRKQIRERKGKDYDLNQIKELIKGRDAEVIDIYAKDCRFLGYGIVNVVNSYNPAVIILGDELSHIDKRIMEDAVKTVLKERVLPEIYGNMKVKISSAVKDSVLHGIGAICIKETFDNYSRYFIS